MIKILLFSVLCSANIISADQDYTASQTKRMPYEFGYGVNYPSTNDVKEHKEETLDDGRTIGEYRILQANGFYRVVRYSVDGQSGFIATVTEEKGKDVLNYVLNNGQRRTPVYEERQHRKPDLANFKASDKLEQPILAHHVKEGGNQHDKPNVSQQAYGEEIQKHQPEKISSIKSHATEHLTAESYESSVKVPNQILPRNEEDLKKTSDVNEKLHAEITPKTKNSLSQEKVSQIKVVSEIHLPQEIPSKPINQHIQHHELGKQLLPQYKVLSSAGKSPSNNAFSGDATTHAPVQLANKDFTHPKQTAQLLQQQSITSTETPREFASEELLRVSYSPTMKDFQQPKLVGSNRQRGSKTESKLLPDVVLPADSLKSSSSLVSHAFGQQSNIGTNQLYSGENKIIAINTANAQSHQLPHHNSIENQNQGSLGLKLPNRPILGRSVVSKVNVNTIYSSVGSNLHDSLNHQFSKTTQKENVGGIVQNSNNGHFLHHHSFSPNSNKLSLKPSTSPFDNRARSFPSNVQANALIGTYAGGDSRTKNHRLRSIENYPKTIKSEQNEEKTSKPFSIMNSKGEEIALPDIPFYQIRKIIVVDGKSNVPTVIHDSKVGSQMSKSKTSPNPFDPMTIVETQQILMNKLNQELDEFKSQLPLPPRIPSFESRRVPSNLETLQVLANIKDDKAIRINRKRMIENVLKDMVHHESSRVEHDSSSSEVVNASSNQTTSQTEDTLSQIQHIILNEQEEPVVETQGEISSLSDNFGANFINESVPVEPIDSNW